MVWNEGYVAEVNYTYGFYGELSPSKLALAATLKSVQSINVTQAFNYCELGCGRGYSSNLLAATYPQAQFYANDFNPSHVIEAKTLAEAAGTRNLHFFEDSFEDFINQELPQFDFIVLHGIYSWISAKNRQAIVNFIRKKLRVGGLVYISYNALPGWAAAMPMQALMLRHGQLSAEPIINRVAQALNFTGQLLEANANYFVQNPILKNRFERLKDQNPNYLAHEYFNQEWNSFYFDEVAKELEVAKLNFIGSSHFSDHVDTVNLTAAAQTQLAQISDPTFREVVRDFFLNTQFRRDLFGRGRLPFTTQEQLQYLQNIRFALVVAPVNIKFKHKFPLGEVQLQEEIYGSICTTLVTETLTLGELQNHPQTQHISLNSLYQALIILIGIGYIHPAVNEAIRKQRQKSTDAFNAAVKTKALYSDEMNYLASPLIGTGVTVNRLEQLLLLTKSRQQSGPEFLWQVLSSQGKKVVTEGKTLETEEENLAYLRTAAEEFERDRLPVLTRLGIS
jgi:predicted O-methyltransferase YrrM